MKINKLESAMKSYLPLFNLYKFIFLRIIISSIILSTLIGLIFFLPLYEENIKEDLYENIEFPDFIDILTPNKNIDQINENNLYLSNNLDWNNLIKEIFNSDQKIENFFSIVPFIHFEIQAFPLFKDYNRTLEANEYYLNGSIRNKPPIILTLTDQENYEIIKKKFSGNQSNFIYVTSQSNPRYVNFNNSLSIIGNENQTISIDRDVFYQYPDDNIIIQQRSNKNLPYLPIYFDSPFIISTPENLFESLEEPIFFREINIEYQSSYKLNFASQTLSKFLNNAESLHQSLKSFFQNEINDLILNSNFKDFYNDITVQPFDKTYFEFKDQKVQESYPNYFSILTIIWIFSIFTSFSLFRITLDQISNKSKFGSNLSYFYETGFDNDFIFKLRWLMLGTPIIIGNLIGLIFIQIISILSFNVAIFNNLLFLSTIIVPFLIFIVWNYINKFKSEIHDFLFGDSTRIKSSTKNKVFNHNIFPLILGLTLLMTLSAIFTNNIIDILKNDILITDYNLAIYLLIFIFILPILYFIIIILILDPILSSLISLILTIYVKMNLKNEFYYFLISIRRFISNDKNYSKTMFFIIITIVISINLMNIQTSRLYFESDLETGSDIVIKSNFNSVQQMNETETSLAQKFKNYNVIISPYIWVYSAIKFKIKTFDSLSNSEYFVEDRSGVTLLLTDFNYLNTLFSNPVSKFEYTKQTNESSGEKRLIVSKDFLNVFDNNQILNLTFYNEFEIVENDIAYNYSIVGNMNFAPRVFSSPLARSQSMLADIFQLFPFIENNSLVFDEIVEAGFFLWFVNENEKMKSDIIDLLIEENFDFELSSQFTGELSNDKSIQLSIYQSFLIPLVVILMIILLVLIVINIFDMVEKAEIIIKSFIYNDYNNKKIINTFYLFIIVNFTAIYIFSLLIGITLSITAYYILIEVSSLYSIVDLNLSYFPIPTMIFIVLFLIISSIFSFIAVKLMPLKFKTFDEFTQGMDE